MRGRSAIRVDIRLSVFSSIDAQTHESQAGKERQHP